MTATNIARTEAPIFQCPCKEDNLGSITRSVYEMDLSPENLKKFWDKAKQFKVLFRDEVGGDFAKFISMLASQEGDRIVANGLFWKIDDMVGVYYMTNIQSYDAQIHYSFFDRRHKGRHRITRMMIQYVFDRFGFHRLSAEVPAFMNRGYLKHGTIPFVEEIGMRYEGTKRKAAFFNNDWYDVRCFGILKEEADNWSFE